MATMERISLAIRIKHGSKVGGWFIRHADSSKQYLVAFVPVNEPLARWNVAETCAQGNEKSG